MKKPDKKDKNLSVKYTFAPSSRISQEKAYSLLLSFLVRTAKENKGIFKLNDTGKLSKVSN